MKIDKDKLFEFCKEYPNTTFMGCMGITVGAVITVALGGFGYMLDMKNDMYEDMVQNQNNKEEK